jgi:hypothetical protein
VDLLRKHKRQWVGPGEKLLPHPKPDLHPKKMQLSVWWDLQGPIYWELLDLKVRINAPFYTQQLDHLAEAVRLKRPDKSSKSTYSTTTLNLILKS